MTTSDEPPFLNVGTEVSAKYRGAFCEATIKIAKKVVKCKISYTKGQTDTVSNDLVKGPLKVGACVEVRQSDGQYLSGVIQKLTDTSTYTVVFDDGDERTLKRSSLCLKGGRHYSASESLDQMPLTDPENFGTPAHFQIKSKRGTRRRRHMSQSSSPEMESLSPVKEPPPPSKYPPEYPVGKCVFLENDRRRAGWVPGVIVPAHLVTDDSEMTEDMICIRSFKDGRFFAAKTSELRDFAPDKEPLSSMLEGEIQPMYMCKPAIERAMAYLDTKELPWDMDLHVFESETTVTTNSSEDHNNSLTDQEESNFEEKTTEEQKQEMEDFHTRLDRFNEDKGISFNKKPSIAGKELDLYKLYTLVKENGGMEKVTQELKWRSLYLQMGIPQYSNSSHLIKQAYRKYLHGFEVFEKARLDGKPIKSKRRLTIQQESDDDSDKQGKTTMEADPRKMQKLKEISSITSNSRSTLSEITPESKEAALLHSEYKVGDRINVLYGKGKQQRTYEAKIIDAEQIVPNQLHFYVHYNGWNTRYDEWIETARIAGKATGPGGRHSGRGSYSKKKHSRLKAQEQNGGNKQDIDSSIGSFNGADSPGTMTAPETPPSCWSGSEGGPIKTPKSAGSNSSSAAQRRRMSSATETSSSDNPQSPDSIPYTSSQHNMSSSSLPSSNKHPLAAKQYPFSPPQLPPVAQTLTFTPPTTATRVPPIIPHNVTHDTISMRTPPQEDCRDMLMETQGGSAHQLVIKKEKNLEFFEDVSNAALSESIERSQSIEEEESILEDMKVDIEPSTPPTMETDASNLSPDEMVGINISNTCTSTNNTSTSNTCTSTNNTNTSNTCISTSTAATTSTAVSTTTEDRQQLDAAYSLIQVNSVVSSNNSSFQQQHPPVIPPTTSPILTTSHPSSSAHPLSPPLIQSENSSVISSSNESENDLSMLMLDTKHLSSSLSSISPDEQQHNANGYDEEEDRGEDRRTPRKRKGGGHDSGVDNSSESDCPESKRTTREELDFSIDTTDLNGLSTSERIGKILERMKEIQQRYMELKTEVMYLDRKRRRARRREREVAKLLSSPSQSSPSQATPTSYEAPPNNVSSSSCVIPLPTETPPSLPARALMELSSQTT